jgi:hypothetical protein
MTMRVHTRISRGLAGGIIAAILISRAPAHTAGGQAAAPAATAACQELIDIPSAHDLSSLRAQSRRLHEIMCGR